MNRTWLLVAAAAIVFAGFALWPGRSGPPVPDLGNAVDAQFTETFATADFVRSDPAAFFGGGGTYCDEEEFAPFDVPHVLPLLERLTERLGLQWIVVSEAAYPRDAVSIYARLPNGVTREQVVAALVEEQRTFPGDILQQWGRDYIGLDFNTPEERAEEEAEDAADGE